MKIVDEVMSIFDGTVKEIFVKNGEAVEFGQDLIEIE
jgi:biotin carboxyl carrier protein